MKRITGLLTIFLLALALASIPAKADPRGRDMGCSPTVANPCTGGSSGSGSGGNSSGQRELGKAIGNAVIELMRGNPEEDARRKTAEEAARRRAEEQELKRQEEIKNRLMGNMMGVDGDSSQLGLMGVDSTQGLQLMTEDTPIVKAEDNPTTKIIKAINALAKRLGWALEEQARLNKALNSLNISSAAVSDNQIIRAWDGILAHSQDRRFMLEASKGSGPGFPGAGTQSFEDCAVFALANAAGLPYGVVAARAAELIRQGEWRNAEDRANPQKAIEKKGLMGGEVVMLAEAFGQAETVHRSEFANALNKGSPILVNVIPEDGEGGHEVVLTKTFQHGGETWYEMIDSNQGPQQRRYLSDKELSIILQENGVAFRPDPGTTPKLLRTGGY